MNNRFEETISPDVNISDLDSVKAFNEARQKSIAAADTDPPEEAVFRERPTTPLQDRHATDKELLAVFLSATPNTRKRTMKNLIGKQKEDGLWDSEGFETLSDSGEEEEVQKKLKGHRSNDASHVCSLCGSFTHHEST